MFLREVGYRKERVLIEDIALDEPLKQIPRHWCLAETAGVLKRRGLRRNASNDLDINRIVNYG
jgi:hypothetical protein